jgi:uncharacterized protein YbjQ (UPF0145 family)
MKTKDVANQFGFNLEKFEVYLRQSNFKPQIKENFFSQEITIDDRVDLNLVVEDYKKYLYEIAAKAQQKADEETRRKIAAEDKKVALARMLITSGFNFDGYTITKYSGYISGDDAISVERGMAIFGIGANVKDKLMESLVIIRRNALSELKEAAYALGCNAVFGVDFDYLTLDPQTANLGGGTTYQPYVFGVTANGNAVIIEKND